MKRLQRILCAVTAFIVLSVPAVFASSGGIEKSSVKVTNNLGTGDVRVSIEEFYDEAKTQSYETTEPRVVVPGQNVNKFVFIKNEAEKAWIRAKAEFSIESAVIEMTESALEVAEGWQKIGDYWYYKGTGGTPEGVDNNAELLFIKGFSIPSVFDNQVSGEDFELNITVEAVQYDHFTPDWSSDVDPWNGTLVESSVTSGEYKFDETSESNFVIEYRGGSHELIKMVDGVEDEDDFFQGWKRFMPGDTFEAKFKIRNDRGGPVTIYFHTETGKKPSSGDGGGATGGEGSGGGTPGEPESSEEPDLRQELLSACTLEIKGADGRVVFSGPMSTVIDHPIALGQYTIGEEEDFTFSVSVPTWLTNTYAMQDAQTVWIFETGYGDEFELPTTGGAGWNWVFPTIAAVLALAGLILQRWGETR